MDNNEGNFVTVGKLVSGLAFSLVLLMGWLFNLITNSTKTMQERQSIASVRSAVNETRIERLDYIESKRRGRVTALEIQSGKNITEINDIKKDIIRLDK